MSITAAQRLARDIDHLVEQFAKEVSGHGNGRNIRLFINGGKPRIILRQGTICVAKTMARHLSTIVSPVGLVYECANEPDRIEYRRYEGGCVVIDQSRTGTPRQLI